MSHTLCTFPGRVGDLLWALPTIRAISEYCQTPVDLQIAGEFTGMIPLLQRQPYLDHVWADPTWGLTPPEEWRAPVVPGGGWDQVFHCGYRGWPEVPLPFWVQQCVNDAYNLVLLIDLDRPWITVDFQKQVSWPLMAAFTEEWFELKFGSLTLLKEPALCAAIPGSRWDKEATGVAREIWVAPMDLLNLAEHMWTADKILCCCSAPHVLAIALGKKVIVYEPSQARHNPIFYPLGMDGRVRVVKGLDGLPTIDVRHLRETIDAL